MEHKILEVSLLTMRKQEGSLSSDRQKTGKGYHWELLYRDNTGSLMVKRINDKWLENNPLLCKEIDLTLKALEANGEGLPVLLRCNHNRGNLNINGLRP